MSRIEIPDWSEPLFDENYRYLALAGGRGSGKSRTVASVLVVMASQKPLRILCTQCAKHTEIVCSVCRAETQLWLYVHTEVCI